MTGTEIKKELKQFCEVVYFHSKNHKRTSQHTKEVVDDVQLDEMVKTICIHYKDCTLEKVKSSVRDMEIVAARQMCMYLIKYAHPDYSYTYIGLYLGGRDHSTVTASIKKVIHSNATYRQFRNKFGHVKAALGL